MTPNEFKEQLLQQREEAVLNLHRIEGAIAACNQLIEDTDEEETTEE